MPKAFVGARQTTLAREVELTGVGVHSGAPVRIVLRPAEADVGYHFIITNCGRIVSEIPGNIKSVKNLTLCTVLGDENGVTVGTVEHLLAALRGLAIDNCYIEINGREVPIMDGSSAHFIDAIDEVGLSYLDASRKFIKVLKHIKVNDGNSWAELTPYSSFYLDVEIDFDTPVIGRQRIAYEMNPGVFRNELSRARTFGFMQDVEQLWKLGLALGASLENSIAIGENQIINQGGLRYHQEFVRHKMLDAVGDLSLAGLPMLCKYRSVRGGHRLNARALQDLFRDNSAWTIVEAPRRYREMGLNVWSDTALPVALGK
ncbi:MAG: UDP-3-O-acyl-N-acetylglucosamine deacetylase [Hyphomicrobiaceae bacterium]|nr:UDP-3-O-acyl-N-acetylglucosamine deacetylase [Hyphomicrobiaceae bacterium]